MMSSAVFSTVTSTSPRCGEVGHFGPWPPTADEIRRGRISCRVTKLSVPYGEAGRRPPRRKYAASRADAMPPIPMTDSDEGMGHLLT